jgi:glycosyltransferase involved in cell wall biosynthesis
VIAPWVAHPSREFAARRTSERAESGRPLHVLHVAPRYLPDLGGIETHIHEVAVRMSQRSDVRVAVAVTDRTGTLPSYELCGSFPIIRRRAWPRTRDYYFAPGLSNVIKGGDWDVIHVQGIHTLVPVIAMRAAREAAIPYVVTFHTGGHSSSVRRGVRTAQWKALAPLLRRSSQLIAVSPFERTVIARATGARTEDIRVVRNGGGLPEAPPDVRIVPGRIVSSGRLERYKGHHRAVEALPYVKRQLPEAHLHILGAGPYEGKLRALASRLGVSDSVTIRVVPPADRREMARSLSEAAVVVAMSDYEAHPVAIMEALALGRPVVGYNVAGVADLVAEGLVTGLPHCASSELAARTILSVLVRAETLKSSTSVVLPTWHEAVDELMEIYRSAVLGSSPILVDVLNPVRAASGR